MRDYRVTDPGTGFVRVRLYPAHLRAFKATWPCSRLPVSRPLTFTFHRATGDLTDIEGPYHDGPDMAALAQEAQALAGLRR